MSKKDLSKRHVFWLTLPLTLIFTYAGVEEGLLEVFQHLDFNINFVFNGIQIYYLIYFAYFLSFKKKYSFPIVLSLVTIVFLLLQMLQVALFNYDDEEYTELYSITLPFGLLVIIAVVGFYSLYKNIVEEEPREIKGATVNQVKSFWIQTSQGKKAFEYEEFQYACLISSLLRVKFKEQEIKTHISLKKLEELLSPDVVYFRLNKQFLSAKSGIRAFKSLKDGRLVVELIDGEEAFVSKNKAASFRKWIDEN